MLPDISHIYDFHPFQSMAVDECQEWYDDGQDSHRLIASPTGTGKSLIALKILHRMFDECWMVTPKIEIIRDMLCKLQHKTDRMNEADVTKLALSYHITTPLRFRNMLMTGECAVEPKLLIKDEAHHDEAETYNQLDALMPEDCRYVGLTATPYRGTPRSTADLYAKWGQPRWAIKYPKAFADGFISMPICITVPLVDDDLIELTTSGQFEIFSVCREVENKIDDAFGQVPYWFNEAGNPHRMTMFSVPSSNLFNELELQAIRHGYKLDFVSQLTTFEQRKRIFANCKACKTALVHINVVSEGVDLSIRNHLDLTPRFSPNSFMQVFGRTTRPLGDSDEPGEYICTNRNLERHAYLLDGCLPVSTVREAQAVFTKASERIKTRAFGLQSLGKLQGFPIRLKCGLTITCYNVTQMTGTEKREYFLILHPNFADPFWFTKTNNRREDGSIDYSVKWKQAEQLPTDFKGFKSATPHVLTTPQKKKWDSHADRCGLDDTQKIDAKKFQILFVLLDVGIAL